jgi:putative ATPase
LRAASRSISSASPDELEGRTFYHPVDAGLEIRLREKLESLRAARQRHRSRGGG